MENPAFPPTSPTTVNRTVLRRPNAQLRTREHLTTDEVERLIETATANRQGRRDALMILLAFRHGLRAAEVCDLRWEQVGFKAATLHVRRTKNGTPATHPLTGRELRALRASARERPLTLRLCQRAWGSAVRPRLLANGRARWAGGEAGH
jgi:integrase